MIALCFKWICLCLYNSKLHFIYHNYRSTLFTQPFSRVCSACVVPYLRCIRSDTSRTMKYRLLHNTIASTSRFFPSRRLLSIISDISAIFWCILTYNIWNRCRFFSRTRWWSLFSLTTYTFPAILKRLAAHWLFLLIMMLSQKTTFSRCRDGVIPIYYIFLNLNLVAITALCSLHRLCLLSHIIYKRTHNVSSFR